MTDGQLRENIVSVLKADCIICNYYEELGKGTDCPDCPFCKNSSPERGKPSRVGIRQAVFRPLGLTLKQCQNWGKCQLFMYLYYPELEWTPPPIPEFTENGKKVMRNKIGIYHIHHINGNHHDDRKSNLTWKLSQDHGRYHDELRMKRKLIKEDSIRCAIEIGMVI